MKSRIPVVLSIAGHDPSGGAGIQADIETIRQMGCHACSVVTVLTVQNTGNVVSMHGVDADLISRQLDVVSEDITIDAIKIGLIGYVGIIDSISQFLETVPDIPVVLDPVLAAGGGTQLASSKLLDQMKTKLLPKTSILTPNSIEARQLAPNSQSLQHCAEQHLRDGCQSVLITGTHENNQTVINCLYDQSGLLDSSEWPRLDKSYHGSGCTLSAAIASGLAHDQSLLNSVRAAQQMTWDSLQSGYQPGRYQYVPNR
ncbi:MAG: hydroxymethylpyrimidine/phosphomethylpyrimidine kinase [Gammaproteobacteria bacterium]|nr:hydroxymethylpyrimidine/phosphomethylpyrimidine kinase [Gammaproteobacteria bacterium]